MKTINDFTFEQQKQIVANDNELLGKFEYFLQDNEMYWVSEKLDCIKKSLSNWEIGFYSPCFIRVKNWFDFVDGVEESCKNYGLSEKCEKLLNRCKNLRYSNLFEYYAEKLKDLYLDEELKAPLEWIENQLSKVRDTIPAELDDSFDCWLENGILDGYGFEQDDDSDEITIYEPQKSRTIHI